MAGISLPQPAVRDVQRYCGVYKPGENLIGCVNPLVEKYIWRYMVGGRSRQPKIEKRVTKQPFPFFQILKQKTKNRNMIRYT